MRRATELHAPLLRGCERGLGADRDHLPFGLSVAPRCRQRGPNGRPILRQACREGLQRSNTAVARFQQPSVELANRVLRAVATQAIGTHEHREPGSQAVLQRRAAQLGTGHAEPRRQHPNHHTGRRLAAADHLLHQGGPGGGRGDLIAVGGVKTGIDRFAAKGRQTSIRARQERAKQQATHLAPVITEAQAGGATTLQAIADALTARGLTAPRGGRWTPTAVKRVLARTS